MYLSPFEAISDRFGLPSDANSQIYTRRLTTLTSRSNLANSARHPAGRGTFILKAGVWNLEGWTVHSQQNMYN